jgi:hypothetical protein
MCALSAGQCQSLSVIRFESVCGKLPIPFGSATGSEGVLHAQGDSLGDTRWQLWRSLWVSRRDQAVAAALRPDDVP